MENNTEDQEPNGAYLALRNICYFIAFASLCALIWVAATPGGMSEMSPLGLVLFGSIATAILSIIFGAIFEKMAYKGAAAQTESWPLPKQHDE